MKHNMSKTELINNQRYMKQKINSLMPQFYAALTITMAEQYGWSFDEIKTLIEATGDTWNMCAEHGLGMLHKCMADYGIDIVEVVGGDDKAEGKRIEW